MRTTRKVAATAVAAGVSLLAALTPLPTVADGSSSASANSQYDPNDWPTFNRDASGSRYNSAENRLIPSTVGGLHQVWRLPTDGAVHGTPAAVDGVVYAGDSVPTSTGNTGSFYAVDAETGRLKWKTTGFAGITDSALVTPDGVVVFGDQAGKIYGLNADDGSVMWTRPSDHPTAAIYSSAMFANGKVIIGISSNEEQIAGLVPGYQCCTFQGSVVALNPRTGALAWQRKLIDQPPTPNGDGTYGPSGVAVWSTPTYDKDTNRIYVSTGNNYSKPATAKSDSVLALDASTGAIVWSNQLFANDIWNFTYPGSSKNPDYDFGDSPQVYTGTDGHKLVAVGQKSGFLHVLDAATGKLLYNRQLVPGGLLGGLFPDSAQVGDVTYANAISWPNYPAPGAQSDGYLVAVRNNQELWRFPTPNSPNMGGVAVTKGIVYFLSSRSGTLYALNAATGAQLAAVGFGEASPGVPNTGISGPSVSNGRVYVGLGEEYGFVAAKPTPGAIVGLGI